MKYSAFLKTVALILTACCLLTAAACAVGVCVISEIGLYNSTCEEMAKKDVNQTGHRLTQFLANAYVARAYSDMPAHIQVNYAYDGDMDVISQRYDLVSGKWAYAVYDMDGKLLESSAEYETMQGFTYEATVSTEMLVEVFQTSQWDVNYIDGENGYRHFKWQSGPGCVVALVIQEEGLMYLNGVPARYGKLAEAWRYGILGVLLGALVVGILCVIYLCRAAGRSKNREGVHPGGLNRLPLDLYGCVAGFLFAWGLWMLLDVLAPQCFLEDHIDFALVPGMVILTAMFALLILLLPLGWCFALAAQIKAGNAYWWHHSVIGWVLGKLFAGIRFVIRFLGKLIAMLPLIGRRLLIVAALLACVLLMFLCFANGGIFFGIILLLWLFFGGAALFAYDLFAMGKVLAGAKRMAEGDLLTKIDTRYLIGSYKTHGENLNVVAEVATKAAKQQLKSERMKTELITNVSHDIKTPLTSIINYVDLLQKPHTDEEGQQYLDVLARQSYRMKKLLEDLMDMSKASTGDMTVELTRMDAGETVNQALGEFADKLGEKNLQTLFAQPETPIYIRADGRLTWRVLSNLLSNTVKYAMPGTRVYIGLEKQKTDVVLSIKNISSEPLNVTADELTERFVRGDAARNTEGSGLGLNIAKSLMELQKGSLELKVDGDLFKVTLTFPGED